MNIGAEPKKLAILAAVVVLGGGIVYWANSSSDTPSAAPATPRPAPVVTTPIDSPVAAPPATDSANKPLKRRDASGRANIAENNYKFPPPPSDPSKVDPTLRLDLLAKVQSVELEGGVRNLFQFSQPPPAPQPDQPKDVPKVGPVHPDQLTQVTKVQPPPAPPGPPPPPPINLKYYGYSTKRSDGERKAFFLDGEDVIVAAEGEIIKKQYKVVRITNTSVQMEDTSSKTTQTLPIQQDAAPV